MAVFSYKKKITNWYFNSPQSVTPELDRNSAILDVNPLTENNLVSKLVYDSSLPWEGNTKKPTIEAGNYISRNEKKRIPSNNIFGSLSKNL